MLILTLNQGERVRLQGADGEEGYLHGTIHGKQIRLALALPKSVKILREKILNKPVKPMRVTPVDSPAPAELPPLDISAAAGNPFAGTAGGNKAAYEPTTAASGNPELCRFCKGTKVVDPKEFPDLPCEFCKGTGFKI